MLFIDRVRQFKGQVFSLMTEFCKDESKLDYDAMAKLICDHEELGDENVIKFAMKKIQSVSSSINESEKKLSSVVEAIQFKHKRMMNFVLEKNDFNKADFFDV